MGVAAGVSPNLKSGAGVGIELVVVLSSAGVDKKDGTAGVVDVGVVGTPKSKTGAVVDAAPALVVSALPKPKSKVGAAAVVVDGVVDAPKGEAVVKEGIAAKGEVPEVAGKSELIVEDRIGLRKDSPPKLKVGITFAFFFFCSPSESLPAQNFSLFSLNTFDSKNKKFANK